MLTNIPINWKYCNGKINTPDLRNSLIICASADLAGLPAATIAGSLQSAGGSTKHYHSLATGDRIADNDPTGPYWHRQLDAFNYPPTYSLAPVLAMTGAIMLPGIIVMWSGNLSNIPAGYVLCDGGSGTPDLTDKFIIGGSQTDGTGTSALIAGAQQTSGGSANHQHTLPAGTDIPDNSPGGDFTDTTEWAYNYPPTYSLAYVMKTP